MATSQNRHYRLPQDSDVDWRDVVGDLARDVDADVANVALNGGSAGGAVVTSTNVAANLTVWTDTGIVLTGTDALIMEATGAISHNAGPDPLYGPEAGAAELRAVLVTDGGVPLGDVAGEVSYRVLRYFVRQPGRLWLRIRDVGGSGDNRGSFDVALKRYEDANKALALLIHRHTQGEVDGLVARLASIEARLSAGAL